MAKKTQKRSRRSRRRTIRRHKRSKRGGGIGATSATWPPDNSAFGREVGSPVNSADLGMYGKDK